MSTLVAALVLFGGLILVLLVGRRWTRAVCAGLFACTLAGCGGGGGSAGVPPNGNAMSQSPAPGMQPSPPIRGQEAPPSGGSGGTGGSGGGGSGPGHAPEINPTAAVAALVLLGGLTLVVVDRRRRPSTRPCV